jgi:hypothetical protein
MIRQPDKVGQQGTSSEDEDAWTGFHLGFQFREAF